jgi:hypothetical protein
VHRVTMPDASPHLASTDDTNLLLADLVTATKLGDRAILLEPYASPSVCVTCMEAYRAAWHIVSEAGGATEWLKAFEAAGAWQHDATESTMQKVRDGAGLVVHRYCENAVAGRGHDFYGSLEKAMRAAAAELVSEAQLDAGIAERAVREAVKFVMRGGRWRG